jgi:hypothetical protein
MPESDRTARFHAPVGPCTRRYVDANGVAWCVRERSAADRVRALYFESVMAFRRVTRYPPNWRELPTGELEILSRKT